MFCPQCKAEYRLGFTKCSDCGVDLVEHLDDGANVPTLQGDPNAMEVLWAGATDNTRQAVERVLKAAKIQYELDSVESNLMPAFQTYIYRIRVRRGDYQAAVAAIQNVEHIEPSAHRSPGMILDDNSSFLRALGINRNLMGRALQQEPASGETATDEVANPENPLPEPPDDGSSELPESDSLGTDIYPEDATSEVWSGGDTPMAQDIKACLAENRIACVISDDGGKHRVMVLPADEARAKEIVREIVEESPPQ